MDYAEKGCSVPMTMMNNNHMNGIQSEIKAPVLLIGFNRPDTMQRVFDAVRLARPNKLYYAVDGARSEGEEEDSVRMVRDIIKQVDWPCEVHALFREKNLGCGFGPADAITWAFENEEKLIVLEDDCVPSQSFFRFCDELLERFKNDTRINMISGRSHEHGSKFFAKYDFLFTHYAHTWGWATWKRSWNQFDIYMKDLPDFLDGGGAINILATKSIGKRVNKSLAKKLRVIEREVTHSWDSQWSYARLKTGLGIVPSHNLIHNIGDIGTHSKSIENNDMPLEEMPVILKYPKFVTVNREYELYHYKHVISKRPSLLHRLVRRIKREGLVRTIKYVFIH